MRIIVPITKRTYADIKIHLVTTKRGSASCKILLTNESQLKLCSHNQVSTSLEYENQFDSKFLRNLCHCTFIFFAVRIWVD